jgi:hypothetical protein
MLLWGRGGGGRGLDINRGSSGPALVLSASAMMGGCCWRTW